MIRRPPRTTIFNYTTIFQSQTWDATDACSNHSATVTQTITATDTHAPTIGAAGGNATIDCTASPSFTPPTASDDCSGAPKNSRPNSTHGNTCDTVFSLTRDATD